MSAWVVPPSLHDVLGERTSRWQVLVILSFGVGAALWLSGGLGLGRLPWWRAALVWLLVMDIAAGCVANFSRGTNDYYAARPRHRAIFLAIHVHVLVVCWALGAPLWPAFVVWAYTVAGAALVNRLRGTGAQPFTAGSLLALGLVWMPRLAGAEALAAVFLLFLAKVLYSFAVDHYPQRARAAVADGIADLDDEDEPHFLALIASSFAGDPLFVWLFGAPADDPAQAKRREVFVRALWAMTRSQGGVARGLFLGGALRGAYLLTPPRRGAWGWLREVASARHFFSVWRTLGGAKLRALNDYQRRVRAAAPGEPHHYLAMIGVAPESQGQGLGRRLMDDALSLTARSGTGLALDTEREENVLLYQRWGFSCRASLPLEGVTAHVMFHPGVIAR